MGVGGVAVGIPVVVQVDDAGVVDEASSLDGAQAVLEAHPDTDLVLLDLHMPGSHGLMGLATLRAELHQTFGLLYAASGRLDAALPDVTVTVAETPPPN